MLGHRGNQRYRQLLDYFAGAVSSRPVEDLKVFFHRQGSADTDLVCMKHVVVASATVAFLGSHLEMLMGMEPIFFQYRSDIMTLHGLDPYAAPVFHQIVLMKKSTSQHSTDTKPRRHFRDIANFDALERGIREKYPSHKVIVLDPTIVTLQEQLAIISKTGILVTPPGGISMLIPFLPPGAHAIILDYWGSDDRLVNTRYGESVSMEASLWNVFPHVTKQYYQIMDASDIQPDFEGATNTRDDFSVVVDLNRIVFMVNQAMLQAGSL
ncbi:hypothetical protein HDU91_002524 [Kappamyces sp. JEL0680]|nr:hypothetical protein HDU91_002524 [Kappamyces sp. JEL0680]